MDPVTSTNLFLDALLATPGWDADPPWVAAQRVQRSRENLLARTRVAEQEHRGIGRRHFDQARDRRAQRRTVADDLVEAVQVIDFLAQVLALESAAAAEPGDFGRDLAQRLFLPVAMDGRREDVRDEPHALDDRRRPAEESVD